MNGKLSSQRVLSGFSKLLTAVGIGLIAWMLVDKPTTPNVSAAATAAAATSHSTAVDQSDADTRKPIEDIRVGDLVWAYNEESGQLEQRRVAALFRSVTDHLRILTLESGSGDRQRIETTDEHPFWVEGQGWQEAQHLRPGDKLLTPDRSPVTVASSVREEHPGGLPVYNFEVEGLHDYFVSATAADALVLSHNMCRKAGGTGGGMTPYRDPQRPNWNNGKTHKDHIQARSLDGPDTRSNIQDLAAETNVRKGGHEGALKSYEQELIRNGMSPKDARSVIQSEIDSLGVSPPPRPTDPGILDRLPVNPND